MLNTKKYFIFIIILSILIFTLGCKSSVKLGDITGVVTLDGTPSSNITVSVSGTSTTTNSNGIYTLTGLTEGSVVVVASKSGYSDKSTTVIVTGGSTSTAPTINLTLGTGSISGTARLYQQLDYTGITVEIVERNISAITDSLGGYLFSGLDEGTVTLRFSKSGYNTSTVSATITKGQNTVVSVVNLASSTGTISGYAVFNNDQTNHSGINIAVSGNSSLSSTTASDGSFSITSVPSGTQTLIISKTGYATRTIANLEVTGNQSTSAGTTPLYPEYDMSSLSGTILSMTQANGYLYIATTDYLYKVSTVNPTVIADSVVVTNDYESMLGGLAYSNPLSATINMIGAIFTDTVVQLPVYNESLDIIEWMVTTENHSPPPATTLYENNLFFVYYNSSFLKGSFNGGGMIATYNVNETGIISLEYGVNDHFYACNSTTFYKYDDDNFVGTPYSVTVEPLGGGTDLIGIAYIDDYIWLIDKTTKKLMKIKDDAG